MVSIRYVFEILLSVANSKNSLIKKLSQKYWLLGIPVSHGYPSCRSRLMRQLKLQTWKNNIVWQRCTKANADRHEGWNSDIDIFISLSRNSLTNIQKIKTLWTYTRAFHQICINCQPRRIGIMFPRTLFALCPICFHFRIRTKIGLWN